ncbi:MAG: stage II sporulation protein M [Dehalococcoidales bacterium]|jgi:stage II sporulation protein M|nr:stage II sporulation protein M [Dehalococcoidales bacterium]MDP7415833.1 stage II sporulation protein M [Dehalococcoidales bacterium]
MFPFLMSYKKWIYVAVVLFVAGMIAGVVLPEVTAEPLEGELALLEQFAAMLGPFQITTALFIFLKNVFALLTSFVLSPLLCLVPISALVLNGGLIAYVSTTVIQDKSVGFLLAGLMPHGIFEIPAIIMGEAAALSFGAMVILMVILPIIRKEIRTALLSTAVQDKKHIFLSLALFLIAGPFHTVIILALLNEQTRAIIVPNLKQNIRYLMIACALLLPAAVIETYITPLFLI